MISMTRVSTVPILFAMVLVTSRGGSAQDSSTTTIERVTPFDLPNPFSESDIVPAPTPKGSADPAEVLLSAPRRLTMPVDELLERLGRNPMGTMDGIPYPFTPQTCAELSLEAIRIGLYEDAIALTEFALQLETQSTDPSERKTLLYVKAVSELAVGQRKNCTATMRKLADQLKLTINASEADILRELQALSPKVGGPLAIRFRYAFMGVVRTSSAAAVATPD